MCVRMLPECVLYVFWLDAALQYPLVYAGTPEISLAPQQTWETGLDLHVNNYP